MKSYKAIKPAIQTLLFALLLIIPGALFAQDAGAESTTMLDRHFIEIVFGIIIFTCILILAIMIFLSNQLIKMYKSALPEDAQQRVKDLGLVPSLFSWKALDSTLNDAVPIEKEADIMMDHEYDGIHELDNHLPPWWKWLFYATVIYAVGYMAHHYVLGTGKDQYELYEEEMLAAQNMQQERLESSGNMVDENSVTILTDNAAIKKGEVTFQQLCAVCHGSAGEGGIGPNMTDQYWIHGGSISDIFKTIKYGVIEKGMQPWQKQLKPQQMQEVASYILTLQGTNPANGKEPQGELYVPEVDSDTEVMESDSTATDMEAPMDEEVDKAPTDDGADVTMN